MCERTETMTDKLKLVDTHKNNKQFQFIGGEYGNR